MLEFLPITLDLRDEYMKRFMRLPVKSADYTFTNLWGWADKYGLSIAFTPNFAVIHQKRPYHCVWAPVGDWFSMNMPLFHQLINNERVPFCEEAPTFSFGGYNGIMCMHRVPEVFANYLEEKYPGKMAVIESKGQWEYLYSREELATLSGNRFHKKKNHVNAFYKNYESEFYPLTTSLLGNGSLEHVLELQNEWCKWHDCANSNSLIAENEAISRIIGNWDRLGGLFGASLYIDNKMAAFAVGERLDDNSLVVHFEKANAEYRGIYQAINHCFVNNCATNFEIINREQDMDEEGIRQAKQSYNPIGYLKKSTLVFMS